MIEWYTDKIYYGGWRYLFNLITSAVLIAILVALVVTPEVAFDSIIDSGVRQEYYDYFRDYFFLSIITIVGVTFLFIGFDLMRDEWGFMAFLKVVVIGFGILMALIPQIFSATTCGTFLHVDTGHADAVAAFFRSLPRFGFLYTIICGVYYCGVGIAGEYTVFDDLSPIFPLIGGVVSFLLSFGLSVMMIK